MPAQPKPPAAAPVSRKLDARPDTVDFRDQMYVPTLVEVPTHVPMDSYLRYKVPVLDQGSEGACTGFGLATVANYLLRRRQVVPDTEAVSQRMLYDMARRYDEWPGEAYAGSSARGAMKGWHKHGVCADAQWPYTAAQADSGGLTGPRADDALRRPLGAYFRVNHRDLVAMHTALAEVGILYATGVVHTGWNDVGADGLIAPGGAVTGGHAFAIVAYDADGFWIQNSWGTDWGRQGFALLRYDDWLANGTDVWVARLGVPIKLRAPGGAAAPAMGATAASASATFADLRPHVVNVGNDGRLREGGSFGMNAADLERIFTHDIRPAMANWPRKRLLLYAHGGLVSEAAAVQRLAEYRPALLAQGVYPLAFVWHSDYWTTLSNMLQDAVRRRRPEGLLDAAKDFMLDRLDDGLEFLARTLTGKASWDEMKENALGASRTDHAAHRVAAHVAALARDVPELEIHIVGHSAGAILHAPLLSLLTGPAPGHGLTVKTCTLWAPACSMDLFGQHYLPAIEAQRLERFALYALSDKAERDDNCARIYNKSLLYLVSDAFEARPRIPAIRDGVPLLGMEKFINGNRKLQALIRQGQADLVVSPNDAPDGTAAAARARAHGGFDDDPNTVLGTFLRITSAAGAAQPKAAARRKPAPGLHFNRSAASLRAQRRQLESGGR